MGVRGQWDFKCASLLHSLMQGPLTGLNSAILACRDVAGLGTNVWGREEIALEGNWAPFMHTS